MSSSSRRRRRLHSHTHAHTQKPRLSVFDDRISPFDSFAFKIMLCTPTLWAPLRPGRAAAYHFDLLCSGGARKHGGGIQNTTRTAVANGMDTVTEMRDECEMKLLSTELVRFAFHVDSVGGDHGNVAREPRESAATTTTPGERKRTNRRRCVIRQVFEDRRSNGHDLDNRGRCLENIDAGFRFSCSLAETSQVSQLYSNAKLKCDLKLLVFL